MKKEQKRFDMNRRPDKPKWWLKVAECVAAPFYMLFNNAHTKTDKEVKKIKGPYIILSAHDSFMDFAQIAKGVMPKSTGWVVTVEEFRRGNWLMYGIGGIPKRRFTHDIVTASHMLRYIKQKKHTITVFPEARFCNAGITERIDMGVGKFCKKAGVPVVICMINGNYLNSPVWGKHPYRRIRQEAHLSLLLTPEQIASMSADEIQTCAEKALQRDEYKWQVEKGYHIKCKQRAKGLHRILYKCPVCGQEFKTNSEGVRLWCESCGAEWHMDTLSRLKGVNTDKGFSHIPDWYNWEREQVRQEVVNGSYQMQGDVRVEDFYSDKVGIIPVGKAHFTHDQNGFVFDGEVDGQKFDLTKPVSSLTSVHIEYDFIKRGACFDIPTRQTSYFMFVEGCGDILTKMHFAQEEMYDFYVKNNK